MTFHSPNPRCQQFIDVATADPTKEKQALEAIQAGDAERIVALAREWGIDLNLEEAQSFIDAYEMESEACQAFVLMSQADAKSRQVARKSQVSGWWNVQRVGAAWGIELSTVQAKALVRYMATPPRSRDEQIQAFLAAINADPRRRAEALAILNQANAELLAAQSKRWGIPLGLHDAERIILHWQELRESVDPLDKLDPQRIIS
jgi:hypothetical protein